MSAAELAACKGTSISRILQTLPPPGRLGPWSSLDRFLPGSNSASLESALYNACSLSLLPREQAGPQPLIGAAPSSHCTANKEDATPFHAPRGPHEVPHLARPAAAARAARADAKRRRRDVDGARQRQNGATTESRVVREARNYADPDILAPRWLAGPARHALRTRPIKRRRVMGDRCTRRPFRMMRPTGSRSRRTAGPTTSRPGGCTPPRLPTARGPTAAACR